jgi:hypothetical protein
MVSTAHGLQRQSAHCDLVISTRPKVIHHRIYRFEYVVSSRRLLVITVDLNKVI